jgi:uncharacterized protein YjbI with pentapeptide repeats
MANEAHLAQLQQGAEAWNHWRLANHILTPSLSKAELARANLRNMKLEFANLVKANLRSANLSNVDLTGANLFGADLSRAVLSEACLTEATLAEANLHLTFLGAADLKTADLRGADLSGAVLSLANLFGANCTGANLSGADLQCANLVRTNFKGANLTGCRVYGISAWNINLVGAQQSDLIITFYNEPVITVDNMEVAQFIYLLLHNEKIRGAIDTITSKAVLILGRFNPKRKAVLDAIREELRRRNYLPILFDFEKPASRDLTETISTLAHMARFIIADLTEPSSLPKELEAIVPTLAVPVQPVMEGATRPYAMFPDYWKYSWVLKVYRYENLEGLITALGDKIIAPAEGKVQELEATRNAIAEELLKQRTV